MGGPASPLPPVKGEGRKDGYRPSDIPDGYISWEEHYEAWGTYNKVFSGQSAETVANRGGFSYNELVEWLGHHPKTWEPRDKVRFSDFRHVHEPEEIEESTDEPDNPVLRSHIWFSGSEKPVCRMDQPAPDEPFNFDSEEAAHCSPCLRILHNWVAGWISGGIPHQGDGS